MKKLRMIVTSVIVLAIVGSAFAFNAKKLLTFCIDSNTTTGGTNDCDQTLPGQWIDNMFGATRYYYKNWLGTPSTCTATDNNNCPAVATATIKLSGNDSAN